MNKICVYRNSLFPHLFVNLFGCSEQGDSSQRTSSPWLEQEKLLPLLGKAVPQLIFASKGAQISIRLTSHSQSQSVGVPPNLMTRLGRTPTPDGSAAGQSFALS